MSEEERAYEEFCQRQQYERYAAEQAAMEQYAENEYRLSLVSSIDAARLRELAEAEREGRVVVLPPIKVGQMAWVIRWFRGQEPRACKGIVREIFLTADNRVMVVVSHVARGVYGETVFLTEEDASKKLSERKELKQ